MTRKLGLAAAAIAVAVGYGRDSRADRNFFEPGTQCVYGGELFNGDAPLYADASVIRYGDGVWNSAQGQSTSTVLPVACPVPSSGSGTQTMSATRLYVRDGNGLPGFNPEYTNFACASVVTAQSGTLWVGPLTIQNGSTPGGCTVDDGCYMSTNFASTPGVTTYLDVGGIGQVYQWSSYFIYCLIPSQQGSSASRILGYRTWSPGA